MKNINSLSLLVLIALFTTCYGQKFSLNGCPQPLLSMTGFTFANLSSTFREFGRTPSVHRHNWKCTTYVISTLIANAKYRIVINARDKITGKSVTTSGTIDVGGQAIGPTSLAGAYLSITVNHGGHPKVMNYYIIAAQEKGNYIVLYSCKDVGIGRAESVIVLVTTAATVADIDAALASLKAIGFPPTNLKLGYDAFCAFL